MNTKAIFISFLVLTLVALLFYFAYDSNAGGFSRNGTATPTASQTNTATFTPSMTPTSTATLTPTATQTPTFTPTSTNTPIPPPPTKKPNDKGDGNDDGETLPPCPDGSPRDPVVGCGGN